MYNVAKTAQSDEVFTSNAQRGPRKNTISTCAHLTTTTRRQKQDVTRVRKHYNNIKNRNTKVCL